ncbi:MAG: class I SAM-dependent methyltransferase [Mycobacteriales bacterium]
MDRPADVWASGEEYEPFIGRWSRPVARDFVDWLDLPAGRRWLDAGCGTGALSEAVVLGASPSQVRGVDPSPEFAEYAQRRLGGDSVSFAVGDAQRLDAADGSFDAVVSGLVLNFVPDWLGALHEMRRVVGPGGAVAAYVWDYPGEMWLLKHFWDAAAELDPAAAQLHEGRRFDFCEPAELERRFSAAGLTGVTGRGLVVPTVFAGFEDYWTPFLGGQGPAPSYAQSLEPTRLDELRAHVASRLPVSADGSIALTARAWAVRGVA